MIVSGNGAEFTGMAMLRRSQGHRVDWRYIAPGKPIPRLIQYVQDGA